jgi:dienelactone hydrolase
MMTRTGLAVSLFWVACWSQQAAAQKEWSTTDMTVLERPADRMIEQYLTALIDDQFLARDELLEALETPEQWERHIGRIREFLRSETGPFPDRSPLNARTTRRFERDDYVVENVLFESRPNFLVSGNLYLPKNPGGRRPAVLNVIGHYAEGKSAEHVQRRSIEQARKGFVAFAIDGLGQGERQIQAYTREAKERPLASNLPGGVHKTIGLQAILAGTHSFNIMAWDAIRAIDYLVSRPEVDSDQIACTGASGGGMLTTSILPFEPRIKVAIPTCNPNTYSYHVHLPSGSDHENVFFGAFAAGIDMRGDPLFAHAPKPLLINATSDDHLNPPRGTWELGAWLDRLYGVLDAPTRFQVSMTDGPHGYLRKPREAAYAWLLRWMGDGSVSSTEGEFPIEKEEDLWATPGGDVYQLQDSREPHQLISEHVIDNSPPSRAAGTAAELAELGRDLRNEVAGLLRIEPVSGPPQFEELPVRTVGGRRLVPLQIRPEQAIILPAVFVESMNRTGAEKVWQRKETRTGPWLESKSVLPEGPVVVYLHGSGKEAIVDDAGVVDELLELGVRILAVDLRGTGETGPGRESWHWDYLAGEPLFGQRVQDICACVQWLRRPRIRETSITIWAQGVTAAYASFAALWCDGVDGLILEDPLISFASVVSSRLPAYGDEMLVPGVLERFDLPRLYQTLAPRPVTLINPLLGDKSTASADEIRASYAAVEKAYATVGGQWRVLTEPGPAERAELIAAHIAQAIALREVDRD